MLRIVLHMTDWGLHVDNSFRSCTWLPRSCEHVCHHQQGIMRSLWTFRWRLGGDFYGHRLAQAVSFGNNGDVHHKDTYALNNTCYISWTAATHQRNTYQPTWQYSTGDQARFNRCPQEAQWLLLQVWCVTILYLGCSYVLLPPWYYLLNVFLSSWPSHFIFGSEAWVVWWWWTRLISRRSKIRLYQYYNDNYVAKSPTTVTAITPFTRCNTSIRIDIVSWSRFTTKGELQGSLQEKCSDKC